MHCPYCDGIDFRVVNTTSDPDNDEIRRRRECQHCRNRFTTVERVRLQLPLVIKEGTGRKEPFDRDKLRQGIDIACAKRPVSSVEIERLIDVIESKLRQTAQDTVSSKIIGRYVIEGLKELDEIAYLRYAIVFLGLENLSAVRDEIDRILTAKPTWASSN